MKRIRTFTVICLYAGILLAGHISAAPIASDVMVSLNFDDTPIGTVLKMLAAQNNLNIVVSSEVTGQISITLSDVSLSAALDAILLPNGYNYYINEDIIIVKSKDQWVAGELVPQIFHLKYIPANDAAEAIEPLLSDKGKIIPIGEPGSGSNSQSVPTNDLMVFDYPPILATVQQFISGIDKKKRQVSIEVKIIEANLNNEEKLGINWPKSISASLGGAETPGSESSSESTSSSGNELGVMTLKKGTWQLGYLSVHQLDMVMDFLRQRNSAKLLSNPRLTTLENKTANINIQTVIPIQTINRFSEGAVVQDIVTFQDEEVGISLEVTPRINDDSTITLQVYPIVEEIIGYTGPSDNQKPVTSKRSLKTNVTVKNNETIVLGGLLKENRIENEDKLFLLGSIPIIGSLFTHRTSEVKTTDLLIMITPRIIE